MDIQVSSGIVMQQSRHSVEETVRRLQDLIKVHGLKVFALIDHSGEAEKVGLHMPDTKVVIFGSPKGGTPIMLAAPSLALDLPLRILVSEDTDGKASLVYSSPTYLQARHGIPAELMKPIASIEDLVRNAAE